MRYLATLLLLGGCSTLTLRPRNPDHWARKTEIAQKLGVENDRIDAALTAEQAECDKLDGIVTGMTGTAIVGGVLAGGGGITSLFTDSTPRIAIGSVTLGLGVLDALSGYLATHYSQLYARKCAINLGGK